MTTPRRPPLDPVSEFDEGGQNARAICDRLDILAEAQARTNQVLADLVLTLNAVLVGTSGLILSTAELRGPLAPKTSDTILFARQLRDLAAALDPDDARREAGRQVDFSSGHPRAARGAPGGRS